MNGARPQSALLALLVAIGVPAQQSPPPRVQLPAEPVVFGQAFELSVWTSSRAAFDVALLSPLEVELVAVEPQAGSVTHRRYRARCYAVGTVALACDPAVELVVNSALPQPAGELEWPGDGWRTAAESSGGWHWAIIAGVAALGAIAIVGRRRRPPARVARRATTTVPFDAVAALRALQIGDGPQPGTRFCAELKAIVRRHCAQRLSLPAHVRTSEELVGAARPPARGELAPCLRACDLVLFGNAPFAAELPEELRRRAIAFVRTMESSA